MSPNEGPLEYVVVYGFYIPGVIPIFAVMAFIWAISRAGTGQPTR